MPKIQTLAEMEAESPDGFRNPEISDAEFNRIREESAKKHAYEKLNTPIDLQDNEDEDEEAE